MAYNTELLDTPNIISEPAAIFVEQPWEMDRRSEMKVLADSLIVWSEDRRSSPRIPRLRARQVLAVNEGGQLRRALAGKRNGWAEAEQLVKFSDRVRSVLSEASVRSYRRVSPRESSSCPLLLTTRQRAVMEAD